MTATLAPGTCQIRLTGKISLNVLGKRHCRGGAPNYCGV